jgi:predicted MFS family arabinose efflux permease
LFLSLLMILVAIVLVELIPYSPITFVISLSLLDIGLRAIQTTNIASVYTLDEASHSRINTIYMTTYFLGGAIGTFTGLLCWKWGGWSAVTTQMLIFVLLALLVNLGTLKKEAKKTKMPKFRLFD